MRLFKSHREAKKAKAEQEQLAILKEIAAKQGIELPETPTPWHQKQMDLPSLNLGIKSLFSEDKGQGFRKQILKGQDFRKESLIESAEISKGENNIRKQLGMAPPLRSNPEFKLGRGNLFILTLAVFLLPVAFLVFKPLPASEIDAMGEIRKIEEEKRKAWILKEQERENTVREAREAQKAQEAYDALISAIFVSDVERVKAAIANGADVNLEQGLTTPLHRACKDNPFTFGGDKPNGPEIRRLLVESGADVNRKTSNGNTPLHSAAWGSRGGNIPAARFLIAHGADVNAKNNRGETPWNIASMFGNPRFIQVLISAGAVYSTP